MEKNIEEIYTTLVRTHCISRTLYVDIKDKYYPLNNIKIYNEQGVLFENKYGYFRDNRTLSFKNECIKKNKEDFSLKQNYIIKEKTTNYSSFENVEYCLYIYVGNIDFERVGLIKQNDDIYNKYLINGIETTIYKTSLNKKLYELKAEMQQKIEDLGKEYRLYSTFLEKTDLDKRIKEIRKLNKELQEEKENIDNYVVNEKDFEKGGKYHNGK